MKATAALRTGLVLLIAAVLGLVAAGGTWALWSASRPAGAGTITASSFTVHLTGAGTSVMTLPGGTAATVAMKPPTQALVPGASVYSELRVTNSVDAGGPFTMRATVGSLEITSGDAALRKELTSTVGRVPAGGSCATAQYGATATANLGKGAAATFCLRTTLAANAPETVRQKSVTYTVPVTATQLP